MNKAERIVGFSAFAILAAGVCASIYLDDIRPGLLGACLAWLGAEYLDHLHPHKARQ